MTLNGTSLYSSVFQALLPPLVRRAVAVAEEIEFSLCVHPATGRLLQTLAGGVPQSGVIGETGTGTGVGLAWMASLADPSVSLVSVEIDAERAAAAREVFADSANVTVVHGDAGELFERGPFDLLVHDGGWGSGKTGGEVMCVGEVLNEGGLMTIDDFTPMVEWPPMFKGEIDQARAFWLAHPDLLATEIRVAAEMAVIVGRRTTRRS